MPRRASAATAVLSLLLLGSLGASSAATAAPLARRATALKCSTLVNPGHVGSAIGVAVKRPLSSTIDNVFNPNSRSTGSECQWYPVAPTSVFLAGEFAVQLTVQAGVTASQLHKLVSGEIKSAASPVYRGTVTRPAGLGANAAVAVLAPEQAGEGPKTVVYALRGRDAFFVYSAEAPTANVVAVAKAVFAKI